MQVYLYDVFKIYKILKTIEQNPGITTNKLISNLRYGRGSTIWHLNRLHELGYIGRLEDDNTNVPYYYKKPKIHILTPKGKEFLKDLEKIIPAIEEIMGLS